jgi:hypothetical protein
MLAGAAAMLFWPSSEQAVNCGRGAALSDARMKMLQMRLWQRTGRAVKETGCVGSQLMRVILPNLPFKTSQVIEACWGLGRYQQIFKLKWPSACRPWRSPAFIFSPALVFLTFLLLPDIADRRALHTVR